MLVIPSTVADQEQEQIPMLKKFPLMVMIITGASFSIWTMFATPTGTHDRRGHLKRPDGRHRARS